MIVSHRHRFIFLKTQKTAGTSAEIALARDCGPDDVVTKLRPADDALRRAAGGPPEQNDLVPLRAWRGWELKRMVRTRSRPRAFDHMPARRVRRMVGAETFDSYHRVTIVRNPFDAAISFYHWKLRDLPDDRRPGLSEFLGGSALTPLTWNWEIYTIDDRVVADIVVRYENLAAELAAAAARIGLPPVDLPQAKTGLRRDRRDPREVLSDADVATIRRRFAREIETFGYDLG